MVFPLGKSIVRTKALLSRDVVRSWLSESVMFFAYESARSLIIK